MTFWHETVNVQASLTC